MPNRRGDRGTSTWVLEMVTCGHANVYGGEAGRRPGTVRPPRPRARFRRSRHLRWAVRALYSPMTPDPWLPPGGPFELPGRGTTFVRDLAGPPGRRRVVLLHGLAPPPTSTGPAAMPRSANTSGWSPSTTAATAGASAPAALPAGGLRRRRRRGRRRRSGFDVRRRRLLDGRPDRPAASGTATRPGRRPRPVRHEPQLPRPSPRALHVRRARPRPASRATDAGGGVAPAGRTAAAAHGSGTPRNRVERGPSSGATTR